MSVSESSVSRVSKGIDLIDLAKQIPCFLIDDDMKKKLCFEETLVISCCHAKMSKDQDADSESSFDCAFSYSSSEEDKKEEEVLKVDEPLTEMEEISSFTTKEEIDPDLLEDDYHFYFWDEDILLRDRSVIMKNELPEINPRRRKGVCLCRSDIDFDPTCKCWQHICTCGAETTATCKCGAAGKICVCHPDNIPAPVCSCADLTKEVCTCFPDKEPRPICVCGEKEPCICGEHPLPVCVCKRGPKDCVCHPLSGTTVCTCGKGVDCTCRKDEPDKECICARPEVCFCRSDNAMRPVCTCENPDACICQPELGVQETCPCGACYCFPDGIVRPVCVCDNPNACLCVDGEVHDECRCGWCYCHEDGIPRRVCTCGNPDACLCFDNKVYEKCICDQIPCECHEKVYEECVCKEHPPPLICTCKPRKRKLKKKRTQDGYRVCNLIDSHHTFFGYAYGRRDLIDAKPVEEEKKKFKIIGLNDNIDNVDAECPIHPRPKVDRKPMKASLDCCSVAGGFTVTVMLMGEEQDRFLINSHSNFLFNGAKSGTRLISVVDMKLHTLEENRNEHITKAEHIKEHRNYIGISSNGYFHKVSMTCDEKKEEKRKYIPYGQAHDFILEGANLILMRYLALKRIKGEIKTKTMRLNGKIADSLYICHGVTQGVVNNKPMYVVKVNRIVSDKKGFLYEIRTVMTLKGYIVTHEWVESPYIIHINPLLKVFPEKNEIENHAPRRSNWRNDLQLLSDYIDFKTTRSLENKKYASENPDVSAVIRDFYQAIVMLNPDDTLRFTKQYFCGVLSDLNIPHDDFFECCCRNVRYWLFD